MDDVVEHLARIRAATVIVITDLEDDLAAIAESTGKGPDDEHHPEGSRSALNEPRQTDEMARGDLDHVELWVPDLGRATRSWGWLLEVLGYEPPQDREFGKSWLLGST